MGCAGSRTTELQTTCDSLKKNLLASESTCSAMAKELEDAKRNALRVQAYARFDAVHLRGKDVDIVAAIDELVCAMQSQRTVNWVKYKNGAFADEYNAETEVLVGWLKSGMATGVAALPKEEEEARKAILDKAAALWEAVPKIHAHKDSKTKELDLKGLCQLLVLMFGFHRYNISRLVQVCASGKDIIDKKKDDKQKDEWQECYDQLISAKDEACESAQKKRWLQTFLISIMKAVTGADSPVPRLTDEKSKEKEDDEVIREFVDCKTGEWKPTVDVKITEAMFYQAIISDVRATQIAGVSWLNGLDGKLVEEMLAKANAE